MTDKQRIRFWESIPDDQIQTCRDCGKQDSKYYVQPQPEGYALCADCIGKIHKKHREERRAQLAALPRCEACHTMRGTLRVGSYNPALMCGRCFKKASAQFHRNSGGMFWLAYDVTGEMAVKMVHQYNQERKTQLTLVNQA